MAERKSGQFYVEPFLGAANTFSLVDGNRIGSDSNPYLMSMWHAVINGWIPPQNVTEEEYKETKQNKDKDKRLSGFVGFGCSFGGSFFTGYARDRTGRNYALESYNSTTKKAEKMKGAELKHCDYKDLEIPEYSIVYCDPPYSGTGRYKHDNGFSTEEFWKYCFELKASGHTIFVSEYAAPKNVKCVFEKTVPISLGRNKEREIRTEKLFKL